MLAAVGMGAAKQELYRQAIGGSAVMRRSAGDIARLDPIRAVERLGEATSFLFQRFDPVTRRLRRTVAGLEVGIIGADEDFAAALRRGEPRAGPDRATSPCLVFAGFETLVGRKAVGAALPGHLILRVVEGFDIDHRMGALRLISQDPATLDVKLAALGAVGDNEGMGRGASGAASRAHAAAPVDGWSADMDAAGHALRVDAVKEAVASGMVEGAVLSVGLSRPTAASPFALYRAFAAANPSPYGFVLNHGGAALVGSSPLAFLNLTGRRLHLETDAGTRPVTGDVARDAAAAEDLRENPKDAAEHRVVVEAEREALATIARNGRVDRVVDREVRRFSHVMHLYSALEADLSEGCDLADAILALAPAAAVSGWPKRAAAQLGYELEGASRGPYGGIVGLVEPGRADLAVVIRSLWLADGRASLRVGGKIVAGSSAGDEYREALAKARFLVEGVAHAERDASG